MDSEIEYFRKELRNTVTEMLGDYNVLPYPYKRWLKKIRKVDILKAKSEMFILSNVVSTHEDVSRGKSRAEISVKNISKYLKSSEIKYSILDD